MLFFVVTMAAVHMEVCEKLPDGFDSIHSERWLTDLECMPRSDLQALAKELGIAANRESSMIIVEILQQRVAREQEIFRDFKKACEVLP